MQRNDEILQIKYLLGIHFLCTIFKTITSPKFSTWLVSLRINFAKLMPDSITADRQTSDIMIDDGSHFARGEVLFSYFMKHALTKISLRIIIISFSKNDRWHISPYTNSKYYALEDGASVQKAISSIIKTKLKTEMKYMIYRGRIAINYQIPWVNLLQYVIY